MQDLDLDFTLIAGPPTELNVGLTSQTLASQLQLTALAASSASVQDFVLCAVDSLSNIASTTTIPFSVSVNPSINFTVTSPTVLSVTGCTTISLQFNGPKVTDYVVTFSAVNLTLATVTVSVSYPPYHISNTLFPIV